MVKTFVVRLLADPLADGEVQGQVEIVGDGRIVPVRHVDDLLDAVVGSRGGGDDDGLTARQHEVLALLRSGRSNAEIAQALAISENTVRKHLERIYRALGVRTRAEAIVGRAGRRTSTRDVVSTPDTTFARMHDVGGGEDGR